MIDGLLVEDFVKALITFIVIMEPFGCLPILVAVTKRLSRKDRLRNANLSLLVASIIIFTFLFGGLLIFKFFGISIASFQIAGGIILILIGIMYVLGISIKTEKHLGFNDKDVSSVPIGTPLLAGPGVITTTIILVAEYGYIITSLAALLSILIAWMVLRHSDKIFNVIGNHGVKILSRIMGIILAAIAIEYVRKGIINFLVV